MFLMNFLPKDRLMRSLALLMFGLLVCTTAMAGRGDEHLFPSIPGWNIQQEEQIYDANNLWDIIDGAADLFLEYAFVDLHIARYTNADSIEVKVEIYRHATPVDAFGMYSQERDPQYNFIKIGIQGYLQQGVLNFLDGVYYIKLSTYQTGLTAQNAMQMIGNKFDEHLKQENAFPAVLKIFPITGKLANTEQYVARNFLGYSFLNGAYVARYDGGSTFKVFIIETPSSEKAQAMMAEYLKVLPKDSVTRVGKNRYDIRDPHNGETIVVAWKTFLYGVLNCTDSEKRENLIKEMSTNLPK